MLKEKAGVIAGNIWNALNETEGMTAKQLKKATNLRIFAHQKDKIIRIQNEEYTKFLHHCPH